MATRCKAAAIAGLLLTTGCALLSAGCAMQATGRAPRHTGMGREPSRLDVSELGIVEVEGRVLSVDLASGVVVVEEEEGHRTVRLEAAAGTPIFVEGGVGGFADLREGAMVRASYEEDGARRIARWIEIPRPENDETDAGIEPAGREVAR